MIDWFMLGEGNTMVHTAASSYGISAADRGNLSTFPERFVMGGLTQCTNADAPYYMEKVSLLNGDTYLKIYISPMETYQNDGEMNWIPFIQ